MIGWTPITLGDLIEVKHGFAFKGEYFRDAPPGDILLTPGNFAVGGGFQFGKLKFYDGPPAPNYVLQAGDLLVTMTDLSKAGDTLGYPARVPQDGSVYLHNQRLGKVLCISELASSEFVYWLLRTSSYRAEILASCTGSTVKHTSPNRIKAFRFLLPTKREQQRICEVLAGLDDKIELNRRINETLEAMAQAIFRDWFVDFGPTRRKLEGATDPVTILGGLVSDPDRAEQLAELFPATLSNDGLPEGWQATDASALICFNPKEPLRRGEVAPYSDMASLPTSGSLADHPVDRPFGSGMRFRNGDALMARITPCLENGKAAYIDFLPQGVVGWGSTEFIVLRAKPPVPPSFAYLLVRHPHFRDRAVRSMTGTSGRQRVQANSLSTFQLPQVSDELFEEFGRIVNPFFALISSTGRQNRTLATTRDLLLPKLMSGDIRLLEAVEQLEAAQ